VPNYGQANAVANNFFYGPLLIINEDDFDVKIDRKFYRERQRLCAIARAMTSSPSPASCRRHWWATSSAGRPRTLRIRLCSSETHVFSPSIVNTARYGWTRFFVYAKNWDAGLQLASPSQPQHSRRT
jgi:hypothetical protein